MGFNRAHLMKPIPAVASNCPALWIQLSSKHRTPSLSSPRLPVFHHNKYSGNPDSEDLLTCCLLGERPKHFIGFWGFFKDKVLDCRRHRRPESVATGTRGLCPARSRKASNANESNPQSRARLLLLSCQSSLSLPPPVGGLSSQGKRA